VRVTKSDSDRVPGAHAARMSGEVTPPSNDSPLRAAVASRSATRFIVANFGLILAVIAVTLVGAGLLSYTRTPIYRSTASVLVRAQVVNGSASAPDMATEKELVSSGSVLGPAATFLGMSQDQVADGLSVTVPPEANVLNISFNSANRQLARRAAQEVAEEYVKTAGTLSPPDNKVPAAVIITPANLPIGPASPNHKLDLAIALVVGVVLALGIAFVRDRLDDGVRDANDFELWLEAPVLGAIPRFAHRKDRPSEQLVVVEKPRSAAAKAYRDLRTRLLQVAARRHEKVLLVTCPLREEKSTVAANLAAALAGIGARVAFVCADFAEEHTHEIVGAENHVGLSSIADGSVSLAPALQSTAVAGLFVLAAGPPVDDPAAVLQTTAMRRTLDQLADGLDFVVIDAPPLLAGADTIALAELVGMVLIVGDAKHSTRTEIALASEQLGDERSKLVGGVLDNVKRTTTRSRKTARQPRGERPARSLSQPASDQVPTTSAATRAEVRVLTLEDAQHVAQPVRTQPTGRQTTKGDDR